jgi:hypothetical protein
VSVSINSRFARFHIAARANCWIATVSRQAISYRWQEPR